MLLHFNKILSKRDALLKVIDFMSIVLPKKATKKEKGLLADFFLLPKKFEYHRFSSPARKRLRLTLESEGRPLAVETINTYISSLVKKGYLYRDEDRIIYTHKHMKKQIDRLLESYEKGEPFKVTLQITPPTESNGQDRLTTQESNPAN
jgi:hypothetical protein